MNKTRYDNAMLLNNIFWKLNFWGFSKAFNSFSWTDELYKKAKKIEVDKVNEIQGMENYEIEGLIRVVIGNKYISDISLHFPEDNFIIVPSETKYSIRSTQDLTDFYALLNEKGINAGGHDNAGGVDNVELYVLVELFYNYLKGNNAE